MGAALERESAGVGAVLFEGLAPPRPESFAVLERAGITVRAKEPGARAHWTLELEHPTWGTAELYAPQRWSDRLSIIVRHAGFLTPEEKAVASAARSAVFLRLPAAGQRLLRARKLLLRYLGAILGDVGLVAFDLDAMLPWSRAALDEELAHDADVDVSALYVLHSVVEHEGGPVRWLHSHGLAEAGAFDFDLIDPHLDVLARGQDAVRALTFAIVEGRVAPDTASFDLLAPGGQVAFMPAPEFDRAAAASERGLRQQGDPDHTANRSIVIEPRATGLGRLLSRSPRPAQLLTKPLPEGALFNFSDQATELMADRARRTLEVLRALADEFSPYRMPVLVKLGYETDDGVGREHLWFEVHAVNAETVDATLVNAPYGIARLRQGVRAEHPVERITDWLIPTPYGTITPRNQVAARRVRTDREERLSLEAVEEADDDSDDDL